MILDIINLIKNNSDKKIIIESGSYNTRSEFIDSNDCYIVLKDLSDGTDYVYYDEDIENYEIKNDNLIITI